jgi:phosphatidate cytidylyltransferase
MTGDPPKTVRFGDLGLRVLSGVALAALALFDLWLGGVWVAALAALAAVLMLWELDRMVTGGGGWSRPAFVLLAAAGAGAVLLTGAFTLVWGVVCLAIGSAIVAAAMRRDHALWLGAGLVYIGFAMAYLIVIRDSPVLGLAAVLWLILVVVAADVGAYFVGRTIGGPKLWPRVSPGKTWSGAIGGLVLALVVGVATAAALGWSPTLVGAVSLGVGIASQVGDLLESAVKRRWSVKDSSRLIPGHGGVMDRLDGLMGGLWFFAIYDMVGGGLEG